jgi:hypothetical protein
MWYVNASTRLFQCFIMALTFPPSYTDLFTRLVIISFCSRNFSSEKVRSFLPKYRLPGASRTTSLSEAENARLKPYGNQSPHWNRKPRERRGAYWHSQTSQEWYNSDLQFDHMWTPAEWLSPLFIPASAVCPMTVFPEYEHLYLDQISLTRWFISISPKVCTTALNSWQWPLFTKIPCIGPQAIIHFRLFAISPAGQPQRRVMPSYHAYSDHAMYWGYQLSIPIPRI